MPQSQLLKLFFMLKEKMGITRICNECGKGIIREHDGEMVCENCGVVHSIVFRKSNRIPGVGADNNFNPTVGICLGKNGSQVGYGRPRDYGRMLMANYGEEGRPLAVAALRVHNIERSLLEPNKFIEKMVLTASNLSKQYGYGNNEVFGEGLARIIRKIGLAMNDLNHKKIPDYWAAVCFAYHLVRIKNMTETEQKALFNELSINEDSLEIVNRILTKSVLVAIPQIKR